MGASIKNLILTALLVTGGAAVHQAFAQESDMQQQNTQASRDEFNHKDGLNRTRLEGSASVKKDAVSVPDNGKSDSTSVSIGNSGIAKGDKAKSPEESSDMVSFNFLYYIIQRYKMADIVDK